MENLKNFKHKTDIQIRFRDADMMGHVNNAVYLTYLEYSRIKYFNEVIMDGKPWDNSDGIILARVEINFKKPVLLTDSVSVFNRCSRIGTKSFNLEWIISGNTESPAENKVYAYGDSVMVCYNYNEDKSIEITTDKIARIEKYEGKVLKQ